MTTYLQSKPGLSSTTTLNIPKDWDPTWFRNFISNQLKGADVRNAVGANGISVTGTIASPYATIGFGPGPAILQPGTSGSITLTVNGAASANSALQVNPGAGGLFSAVFNNLPIELNSNGVNQIILNSTGTDFGAISNPSSQVWALGYTVAPGTLATSALTWNTKGQITLTANTTTNTVYGLNVNAPTTTGASFGLAVYGGTNSTDYGLNIANAGNTINYLLVRGDGLVQMGGAGVSPSGVLCGSITALTGGATGNAPTLTAGPVTGNPTKWIAINDAGTVRHIPAW